jgi:hypothetical protein
VYELQKIKSANPRCAQVSPLIRGVAATIVRFKP